MIRTLTIRAILFCLYLCIAGTALADSKTSVYEHQTVQGTFRVYISFGKYSADTADVNQGGSQYTIIETPTGERIKGFPLYSKDFPGSIPQRANLVQGFVSTGKGDVFMVTSFGVWRYLLDQRLFSVVRSFDFMIGKKNETVIGDFYSLLPSNGDSAFRGLLWYSEYHGGWQVSLYKVRDVSSAKSVEYNALIGRLVINHFQWDDSKPVRVTYFNLLNGEYMPIR